jgi:hypothetical protein
MSKLGLIITTPGGFIQQASVFVNRWLVPQMTLQLGLDRIRISNLGASCARYGVEVKKTGEEVMANPKMQREAWSRMMFGVTSGIQRDETILILGKNTTMKARRAFMSKFPLDYTMVSLTLLDEGTEHYVRDPAIVSEGFDHIWKVVKTHEGEFQWKEGAIDDLSTQKPEAEPDFVVRPKVAAATTAPETPAPGVIS